LLQEIHGYDSRFGLRVFKQSVLDSLVAEKGGPTSDGMDVDEPEPGKPVVWLFHKLSGPVAIDVPQSRSMVVLELDHLLTILELESANCSKIYCC
jgi:hypothetical protein